MLIAHLAIRYRTETARQNEIHIWNLNLDTHELRLTVERICIVQLSTEIIFVPAVALCNQEIVFTCIS